MTVTVCDQDKAGLLGRSVAVIFAFPDAKLGGNVAGITDINDPLSFGL
jgi:hypothetical protein